MFNSVHTCRMRLLASGVSRKGTWCTQQPASMRSGSRSIYNEIHTADCNLQMLRSIPSMGYPDQLSCPNRLSHAPDTATEAAGQGRCAHCSSALQTAAHSKSSAKETFREEALAYWPLSTAMIIVR